MSMKEWLEVAAEQLRRRPHTSLIYLHRNEGDPAFAVLVSIEHWDKLMALVPEGQQATDLVMVHDHIEPEPERSSNG